MMLKNRIGWLAGWALLTVVACNKGPDVKTPVSDVPVVQPDTTGNISLAAFEAHVAARTPADTAVADHRRLLAMLTDSIAGYVLEVNEAETYHAPLFTFAEASKVFYNADQDYVELTVGDYVRNPDFFRVNIQRYNLAVGVEISGVKDEKCLDASLRPAGAKAFFAWASYNSRKRRAWFYMGINERYFVTIEATAQAGMIDAEQVKSWISCEQLTIDN
jgi:hypothetical protein